MRNIHLAERLFNTPLMITEHKLGVILRVMGPRFNLDVSGLPVEEMREVTDTERRRAGYQVRNGVAVLPIYGTLVHRSGWLDAMSGVCSYESIRQMFDTAMEDDGVREVVGVFGTNGGEVCGAFDLADHIYASRGRKPLTAIVDEQAFSAGYLLASSFDRLVLPRTAGVGSIGVIASHTEFSRWEEATGITVTNVYAGARKNDFTPHAPLSADALNVLQVMVDDTFGLFIDTVSRNMGLSKEAVRGTEAGIYIGKKAVAAGLAHEVSPADKALAKLMNKKGGMIMPGTKVEGATVEPTAAAEIPAEGAAGTPVVAAAAGDKNKDGECMSAALETARQEASAAERSRVMAIHAACQKDGAASLFAGLVEAGCDEVAAGQRIHDALVLRGEAQQIVSLHGGAPGGKPAVDYKAAFDNVK